MQRAARKVAQENDRLRTLLARHGILKEEIDSFLRSCEQTDGSAEPETPISSLRSPSVSNPYPIHAGPRSLSIQPLGQAYPRVDCSPRPSPISVRPSVPIARQPIQTVSTTSQCGPAIKCGPMSRSAAEIQVEATIMARPVEARRKGEAHYASPSETDSSPPPRTQEEMPAFSCPERMPANTQNLGCCPPPRPQPEVAMEDPDCPSTADCFCPPTTTAPSVFSRPAIGTDEISCETAATIIAQMRGDGDEAAARASIGCLPQQKCSIKNAFLMQVLDER
jgi:hypothetical protein